MRCPNCDKPLLEGATACILCGAPVEAARAPLPPQAPHVSAMLTPPAYAYTPPPFPAQPPPQGYAPYPQGQPYPVAPQAYPLAPPQPNNIAIASFVCGMLGLVPLWIGFALCILAIIFGVLGIQRAGQLPGERGKGLAIAGLILGILFILPAGCGL